MASKLWEKNFEVNQEIERFTVGRDREMDLYLAKYDVLGSMAHITMLQSIGLMEATELEQLLAELKNIYATCEQGQFVIEDGQFNIMLLDVGRHFLQFAASEVGFGVAVLEVLHELLHGHAAGSLQQKRQLVQIFIHPFNAARRCGYSG